ncbi:MAG: response regulator [Lachnospiraceae bacterium]|nr:response regulator [Lachnospiraceae bacterium]
MITKPLFQSVLLDLLVEKYGSIAPKEDVTRDFAGMKVMLAEDNEMNMEISEDILTKAKLSVVKVVNGQEAVDAFLQSQPGEIQAILMDIQMPVMDGYEATKKIRESGREDAESIPIIALTANAFAEDVQRALDAGMNGHIAKPISKQALFTLLDKVL